MSKYEDLVGGPWIDLTLYAESIPHLLHWDLAYLWALEKEPNLRPAAWKSRIEAWRYLVLMLAAGELGVVEEPIPRPLSDYTQAFGIHHVQWVVSPRGSRKIGVLSPMVFVRPLPDFKEEDLDIWNRQRWVGRLEDDKADVARHFVALIIQQLRAAHGSYRGRLANVLALELGVENHLSEASHAQMYRTFPSISRLHWNAQRPDAEAFIELELPIHKGSGSRPHFIPYCPSCGKSLLQRREAAPFVPQEDEAVEVRCAHCPTTSKVELVDLLIWKRSSRAQVIAWRQDPDLEAPRKGYPPEPKIAGSELVFEWDVSLLAGNRDFRYLKIRLPGYTAELRSVSELFYSRLLVPGQLVSDHCCVPFQLDWLDAAQDLDALESEVRVPAKEIVFRHLRVRGWPTEITKVFAGDLGLQVDPGLSVGVYPDPETVCGDWRWFRAFLEGHHQEGYGLQLEGGTPVLPALAESLNGCPDAVAVVRRPTPELGATFRVKRRSSKKGRDGLAYLGIDFGTSNTLVYFAAADQVVDAVRPDRNAVCPANLASAVKWLAGDGEGQGGTIAAFLPKTAEAVGRTDQYLIPSALWQLDGWNFIRWNSDAPAEGSRAVTGFKWDRELGADHTAERRSFFQELILVSLPYVLRELRLSRLESVEVKVGMAFPLAFGASFRRKMVDLLAALQVDLRERTGLLFDFYSVNEAIACADAFGSPNKGETYLIADLGGATLDVALYTAAAQVGKHTIHQVGSLEFGGETFIAAFAASKDKDAKRQEQIAWQVRDDILEGRSRERYGREDAAKRILGRYRAAAFEYLRTMIAAYHKTAPASRVKLVLAGNGWHLSEAFDAGNGAAPWKTVYRNTYNTMVGRLADTHLELYLSPEMDVLPSTKHFVVIGALRNASGGRRRRQLEVHNGEDGGENLSRLPSGRAVEFSQIGSGGRSLDIHWFRLVGEGAKLDDFSDLELKNASIACRVDETPESPPEWISYLTASFGVDRPEDFPYPTPERLREKILAELKGDPQCYLSKGPLQLILEEHWRACLNQTP